MTRCGVLSRSSSKHVLLLFIFLAFSSLEPVHAGDEIVLTSQEWNFGTIPDIEPIHLEVTVRNNRDATLRVSFIPTCDCLFAEPGEAEVAARGEKVFRLTFDPAGYQGSIDMDFIFRSTATGMEKALFHVHGEVETSVSAGGIEASSKDKNVGTAFTFHYYYSPGCKSCERFLSQEIPVLEEELGITLDIRRRNIFDPGVYEEYQGLLESLGEEERAYPSIILGTKLLQGDREIKANLRSLITVFISEAAAAPPHKVQEPASLDGNRKKGSVDLAVFTVLVAGLLDGINPCAFTTLIFLISALAVAGKSRKEVLILGLFYTLSVFTSYYFIGLGFLNAIRYAQSFFLVAQIIRWILVSILVVFAALSFYDYLLIRKGRAGKITLQLPSVLKKRIHISIKTRTRSAALVSSALVLGFLVSMFELACTGQIYLPTIVYAVRTGRALGGYAYLLIYNLGFIAPLLVVFALSFAGLSTKGLTAFFQKSMAAVKLALAGLFAGLAVVTIIV